MEDATLIAAPGEHRTPTGARHARAAKGSLQAPPGWRRRHNRDCSVESLDLDSAPLIVPLDLPAPAPLLAALPKLHLNLFCDLYGTPIT